MSRLANYIPLLTPRDILILIMVYLYDGLVSEMVCCRYFGQNRSFRAGYARLAKLVASHYLRSCPLPSMTGKGTGKQWLTIDYNARPILEEHLDLSPTELKH